MPHKRSKGSLAHKEVRNNLEADLPPGKESLRHEAIPKSAARILNAQRVRDDYKNKHKLDSDEGGPEKYSKRRKTEKREARIFGKVGLIIQPGESLQHFNRKVEDDLRPLIKSTMQSAHTFERNTARQEREARAAAKNNKPQKANEVRSGKTDQKYPPFPSSPKEFATALPKRLNDVAQAPPEFKKLPRGAPPATKKEDVLSMSQKLLMEKEREGAILRYRELKASRQARWQEQNT